MNSAEELLAQVEWAEPQRVMAGPLPQEWMTMWLAEKTDPLLWIMWQGDWVLSHDGNAWTPTAAEDIAASCTTIFIEQMRFSTKGIYTFAATGEPLPVVASDTPRRP